jgi:hypothetical protein
MNTTTMRVVSTGLFFLFIFVSGIWLSRSGRPLNGGILAVHKLVSVAAGVFLIITMVRLNRVAPLSATEWTAIVVTGLCFLGTVVSGGLLSIGKPMPVAILRAHQIMPVLVVISTTVSLYLLLGRR